MLQARPVKGRWRTLRTWGYAILIAILLVVPWIRIGGEPLILLDIPARKFHVFGLVIFPQELFFLWLILAGLAASLFFFTALVGRLWCGWACPQTVFTDLYAGIARRIQGWKGSNKPAHVARWRVVATHAVWIAVSAIVAFHLVGYFRSPYDLLGSLSGDGQTYPTTVAFLAVITALAYFDFAIVQQVFCRFLCPYARFQSVLFDRDTLVVGYDERRGEPRGKKGTTEGDCVDCGLCVAVCPTEIDIRKGMQMECIACTQCIDACDGVMAQLDRPRGLIDYRSLVGLEGLRAPRLLRPRTVIYGVLLLAVAVGFVYELQTRLPMGFHVAHNEAALYSKTADGRISNAFTLHIENRERGDRSFEIRLQEGERFDLVTGLNPIPVPAISATEAKVFVLAREGVELPRTTEIAFVLEATDDPGRRIVSKTRFVSPGGNGGL